MWGIWVSVRARIIGAMWVRYYCTGDCHENRKSNCSRIGGITGSGFRKRCIGAGLAAMARA
jgi:hypothetical protein